MRVLELLVKVLANLASQSHTFSYCCTVQADQGLTGFNDSSLVPLLPYPVAWLLEDAEEELANATRLPVQLNRARTLATQVSVSYCSHPAIRAWNCSR